MSKIVAVAYPGQSEAVRVGLGRTVWIMREGDPYPSSDSLTWRDRPYPDATHEPAAFIAAFPPKPGGGIEAKAKALGLI